MSFSEILFLIATVMTIGGAIGVTFVRNIMHACVLLLISLYGVAGLYITLSATFIAMVQMIVYAGGVVILMLFAVMLTGGNRNFVNRFGLEKIASMGNLKTYSIGILSILAIIYSSLTLITEIATSETGANTVNYTVREIGISLVREHVLAFEISSILLLGALVGAVVIAREGKLND